MRSPQRLKDLSTYLISSSEHSRLIDCTQQLHLGAVCVGICKWVQSDYNDKRTNSVAVSEADLHHYIFIIAQLWLTSHLRSTVVLLDTGTPGTSKEVYSEDADDGLELATPRL